VKRDEVERANSKRRP